MKLGNEKSCSWRDKRQEKKELPPLDFAQIEERCLYVGVSLGLSYLNERDCVVLMYKDRTYWELKTNGSEDAFEFLYRNIKFFSDNRYQKARNSYLKEYIIFTTDASLSTPVKPEYMIRDVQLEKNDGAYLNQRHCESYLKISDWISRLPISGATKRVYLETSTHSNFPFKIEGNRDVEKEKAFLVDAWNKIIGRSSATERVRGWDKENFKDDYFRDAFVSLLVSIAYTRWKSNDKSGTDDFLEVIVDHDGIYWLIDHKSMKDKMIHDNMEKPLSDERG